MFWTRRRRVAAAIASIAGVTAVATGQFAFTNSTSLPATTAGYGSTEISGGHVTAMHYNLNPSGTLIQSATMLFEGDVSGKAIRAGFDGNALTPCPSGVFDGTSTLVNCGQTVQSPDGYNQSTEQARTFHVLVTDATASAGGPPTGGGAGPDVLVDEFNGSNASLDGRELSGSPLNYWHARHGTWNVMNDTAKSNTVPNPGWIAVGYTNTDATASVSLPFYLDSMCRVGLALNASDDGTSTLAVTLKAAVNNSLDVEVLTVQTDGNNTPVATQIAQQNVTPNNNPNNTLKVTRTGSSLNISVNDSPATSISGTSVPSGFDATNFGLYLSCPYYSGTVAFDHFKVEPAAN
jgi:hypothetical protein